MKTGTDGVIFPTGTCFDDTVEILKLIYKAHPETVTTREFLIVHAIVHPDDYPSAHAWVEDDVRGRVLFMGIHDGQKQILAAARDEYYAEMRVSEQKKYSFMEAYREEKRTGRYGPWEERFRRLLRDVPK